MFAIGTKRTYRSQLRMSASEVKQPSQMRPGMSANDPKRTWVDLSRHGYAQRLPNGNTLITESEGDEVGVGGDEHAGYVRNRLPPREGAFFIERTRLRMMCVRTDLCSYVRAPANGSRSVQQL